MTMPETPELDRMHEVLPQAEILQGFYDWLIYEQNIVLYVRPTPIERTIAKIDDDYVEEEPEHRDPERLFADYFGIDLAKVEQERRALLEHLRKSHDA